VLAARSKAAEAAAGVEAATAAAADYAVAVAGGTAGEAPVSIKVARAAVTDAADEVAAAQAAVPTIEARLAEAENDARWTRQRRHDAAVAVLAASPEVARLVAELDRLQHEMITLTDAFVWLERQRAIARKVRTDMFDQPAVPAGRVYLRINSPPMRWDLRDEALASPAWERAFEALKLDADAPLPT
jgi:hypothetical protein